MHLERGAVENLAVTFKLIDPLQLNSSTLRILPNMSNPTTTPTKI